MNLLALLKQFRRGILLALSLVLIENIAWILEPGLFGPVIDALIGRAQNDPTTPIIRPLVAWIGVFLLNSGVGAFRRSYDQKIYLHVFTRIARRVAEISLYLKLPASRAAGRAELSREFITFLQYRTPEIIEQCIAVVGSLIGLALFDVRLSVACMIVLVPLGVISYVYKHRVVPLQADLHDNVEETFNIFAAGEPDRVESYYTSRALPQQMIANYGALSFGLMRLSLLGIFLAVLYIAIDLDDFTTGNIYTIVAYIWTFVTSSEYLPELMESWASLTDISRRLRAETDPPAPERMPRSV